MKYLAYVLRAIWDSILDKESHFLEGQWLSGSLLMFTCRTSLCQLKKFKFNKSVCWNQVMLLPPSWPSHQLGFNWRRTGNKYLWELLMVRNSLIHLGGLARQVIKSTGQIIQEGEVQTLGHEFEAAIHKWTIFFTGVSDPPLDFHLIEH